jgi:hypothetical protein
MTFIQMKRMQVCTYRKMHGCESWFLKRREQHRAMVLKVMTLVKSSRKLHTKIHSWTNIKI